MRLSLRTKQVAGVTAIVALSMVAVNALYLARIARISLEESQSRGELLARTVYQTATVLTGSQATAEALRENEAVRVLVESGMAFSENVTYVAITDAGGRAIVHSSPVLAGELVPPAEELATVIAGGLLAHLRAIYSDRTFEVRERLVAGEGGATREFGAIRVGLSMLLVRENLREAMAPTLGTLLGAVLIALVVATGFAQWLLRPIHVLHSGLARLGAWWRVLWLCGCCRCFGGPPELAWPKPWARTSRSSLSGSMWWPSPECQVTLPLREGRPRPTCP